MCKKMFYAHELDANCKNLKKTWSILNDVLKKPKNKQQISSINSNGELITDPTLIANTFNNFFTTIADEIANLINPVPSPNSNLTDGPGAGDNLPDSAVDPPNLFNMSDVPLTDDEIISSIDSLEDKKKPDMSGFSTHLLKKVFPAILVPIKHIFNRSLATGIVRT
jgi:hypothetical protein